jgi:DNA polymerase III gamma/tau subunit
MPLHTDYRPAKLDEFLGNTGTVEALGAMLERADHTRLFLFTGQAGCGKTTLAHIVANTVGAHPSDIQVINSSNNRGIDTARDIIVGAHYKAWYGDVKVYILDEVHRATKDFQNAMLKIFEEPPKHVYFLLCTTDPDQLLPTIRSRAAKFNVIPLSKKRIVSMLQALCTRNKWQVPDEVLQVIAQETDGVPRDALIALDMVRGVKDPEGFDEKKLRRLIKSTQIEQQSVLILCRRLLNPKSKWALITKILKGLEGEPEQIRHAVLGYMSSVLLSEDNPQAAFVIENFSQPFHYTGKAGLIAACYNSMLDE